jgi:acyl-ACP thioesterase
MYTFTGKIRYSETDAYGFLTPEKLIDYFQDCSTFQSEDLGIGVKKLRSQGLAWIIVYWRVEIYRMPVLGEEVRIGTIPYEMKGGVGLRNFLLETPDGERLAAANSVWTLVDINTMHPVRIPAEIRDKYQLEAKVDMLYDSRKIRLPDCPGEEKQTIVVQEYHLDSNRHMNNGQYVRIAAGLLPEKTKAAVLRIEYRQQAVLGDRITPVQYQDGPSRVCISLNAHNGKPYAIMEMILCNNNFQ